MRTIVINTSKEAINTRLDLLFNAPFDQKSLLWFDTDLPSLNQSADDIHKAIMTEADTYDKDYNLIVLVDLYKMPHGNCKEYVGIYKALITRYIGVTLVNKLCDEYYLMPSATSVYFADSAEIELGLRLEELESNPEEQEKNENSAANKEKNMSKDSDGSISHNMGDPYQEKKKNRETSLTTKIIQEIFEWKDEADYRIFNRKIKISAENDEYLDLSELFTVVDKAIERESQSSDVFRLAMDDILKKINENKSGEWKDSNSMVKATFSDQEIKTPSGDRTIRALTCYFQRENEQSVTEGFFNIFENIFKCVLEGKPADSVTIRSRDEIVAVFKDALKKYNHFSRDKNITVNFEKMPNVFDDWEETFCEDRKKSIAESSPYRQKEAGGSFYELMDADTVAEKIMENKSIASAEEKKEATKGLHGIDLAFYGIVEDIFANYDAETLKLQNNEIEKNCLKSLWKWRDEQTNDKFKADIKRKFNEDTVKTGEDGKEEKSSKTTDTVKKEDEYDKTSVTAELGFIKEKYEEEYAKLVSAVTETEHKLASNQDILAETKSIMIKYSDLIRKGKMYLICSIGAVIAIIASALPYIYIQMNSINENLIHRILYILFTLGFVALYSTATGVYMNRINKEKRGLKKSLEELKKKSETERKESIKALYTFYSDTVVKTETLYLLWREFQRRERENAYKNVQLNNHKKRLEKFTDSLTSFMTKLKIDVSDSDYEPTAGDKKLYEDEDLKLNAEKSFYDIDNRRVYSILPIKKEGTQPDTKNEGGNKE